AALEREVKPIIAHWYASEREHDGRCYTFFENDRTVLVCGGIGATAARRATEAIITLFRPAQVISAGFAGALDSSHKVGDVIVPARVIDAGDSSATQTSSGDGTLVSFGSIATTDQKAKLARAYSAQAVDMEAAAVARAAHSRGVPFLAVKAISDEHDFEMPSLSRFLTDGQFRTAYFVARTALRPWLWGKAVALARSSARAGKALCDWLDRYNQEAEKLDNPQPGMHLIEK
ncbi:MAG TPA: hypothetical protein VGF08_06340, partial [Terriglobales bacterium]